MKLKVIINPEHEEYVRVSARLRGIKVGTLVRKIMDAVLEGQLILATLDDADEVVKPKRVSRARVHISA